MFQIHKKNYPAKIILSILIIMVSKTKEKSGYYTSNLPYLHNIPELPPNPQPGY